ncbi:MAG: hypothetical protein ABL953_07810 [Ilumatobacteraceae bacterium]
MIPKNWKITGIAALALGSLTGVAMADEAIVLNDRSDPIVLVPADDDGTDNVAPDFDASPESADSPAESPFDSVESATDSPDDAGFLDESNSPTDTLADSPADTVASANSPADTVDSANSPADSPEDSVDSAD